MEGNSSALYCGFGFALDGPLVIVMLLCYSLAYVGNCHGEVHQAFLDLCHAFIFSKEKKRCIDCTRCFFGSFVAVRLRSFDDFPFLSDWKLRNFDRKQEQELAGCGRHGAAWKALATAGNRCVCVPWSACLGVHQSPALGTHTHTFPRTNPYPMGMYAHDLVGGYGRLEKMTKNLKTIHPWHTAFKKRGKWVGVGGYNIPKVTIGGCGWAKPASTERGYPMGTQPRPHVALWCTCTATAPSMRYWKRTSGLICEMIEQRRI
ncbi:hypothetical protein KFK09_010690 [Dendrobium nobile]|uniref:Uncharacterized protein n=1 Tax=Dendrobium nobile TaxID=94219 RepID=A0A8T3BCT9_DENNO|nr:hypothetical protein KFK09_010690 [Dendrobium nobile]